MVLAAGAGGCASLSEPVEDGEILSRIESDAGAMFADQEPVTGPIDLYEAVARGLKYNLDKKLKTYERALAEKALGYTATGMLPQLAASAGYRARDSYRGSSSRSLITGRESLEVSTSEDKSLHTADLQMVWNVLDFGLTYLRARQDADRVLIAEERRIKVMQNMVLDIRDAYWRAVAAERILPKVDTLIARIDDAIATSRSVQASGTAEPAEQLKLQRELLSHKRDLVEVRRKLQLAKAELAALINLKPGQHFHVAMPRNDRLEAPGLPAAVQELELAALMNRPELREEDYKKRISLTELEAAYVRLLPGIEIRLGTNYDSNSFLSENSWHNVAGLLTKNLTEILMAERSIGYARSDVDVADARRLSLSMAVVAQLHIALQRYAMAEDVLSVAQRLYGIDKEISSIAAKGAETSATSEVQALAAQSQRTVSELQYYTAYSDVQHAYGRILNSVGAPRLPEHIEALSVADLAMTLRPILDEWRVPEVVQSAASLAADGEAM
jgi:outer membrane protein TolC